MSPWFVEFSPQYYSPDCVLIYLDPVKGVIILPSNLILLRILGKIVNLRCECVMNGL